MSGRSAAIVGAMAFALVASLLVAPTGPAAAAAPNPAPGRLAFTDAQDVVRRVGLDLKEDAQANLYLMPQSGGGMTVEDAGRHSGEARADSSDSGNYAYVSTGDLGQQPTPTAEDPDGEVWYRYQVGAAPPQYVQVTDDKARQSHPEAWVRSTCDSYSSGRVDVAFASDQSGDWDIWVATLVAERTSPGSGICEPFTVTGLYQVTDDPGDDLWPAWSQRRMGDGWLRTVVFSSTRTDPRGDLYEVHVQPGALNEGAAPSDLTTTQLTGGPHADSHPAPRPRDGYAQTCFEDGNDGEPSWLAFTRASDDDSRGGLAVLDLDDPGGGVLSLGVSAASEPAWSPDGQFVAYRSTADDPDGDVFVGRFERTCPAPDLAVTAAEIGPSSGEAGTPIPLDDPVDVRIVVTNTGSSPAGGTVEIDFSDLLSAPGVTPPDSCDGQVCTVAVPELQPGQSHELAWVASEEDPLVALALGSGSVVAHVSVTGLVADAAPGNDELSGPFEVVPPVDLQIPDGDITIDQDGVLFFDTEGQTLEATITVAVLNPDPSETVDATLVITSDGDLVAPVRADVPLLGPGENRSMEMTVVATSPPAGSFVSVELTAEAVLSPPPIDPNPSNNRATIPLDLDATYDSSASRAPIPSSQPGTRFPQPASSWTAAVPVAAPAALAPATILPAQVPPPAKDPVEDSVALSAVTPTADTYGVAESHPTFVLQSDEQLALLFTSRPDGSGVADVLSSDGSDRHLLADGASGSEIGHPSYSPDGRFIAFHRHCTSPRNGCRVGSDIVVANADGSNPIPIYASDDLREAGDQDLRPAWSPDGTALAFTRIVPSNESESRSQSIWVARGLDLAVEPPDLVAEDVTQLTTPNAASNGETVIVEADDEAAWSPPDVGRIAFTRTRYDTREPLEPGAYDSDIWVIDLASPDDQHPLLAVEVGAPEGDADCPESRAIDQTGTVCRGGDDRGADWSPDGSSVVYEHTGWLYLADPKAGTDLGPVTGPRILDSADDRPVYPDDPPGSPSAPGDPASAFFPELEWAQDPSWSPNGDRIAFSGQPRGQPDQRGIYWLTLPDDPDAREIREIAQQPHPELEPDWQPTADLSITLSAVPAAILTGEGSVLSAAVTNEGPAEARSATVSVTFPTGLTPGSLPAGCTAGEPVVCSLGNLPNGGTATLDFPVVGTTAGALETSATTNSSTVDPDPDDNTATATITVALATADLSITLTAAPASILVGGDSVLTAIVSNDGPGTAQAPTVTVSFPAGLTPGSLPAGCTAGEPVVCSLGNLPNGGTATLDFPVVGTTAGALETSATTNSTTVDPDPDDNTATATITVSTMPVPTADLSVTLTAVPATVQVGDGSVLTAIVSNGGPATAQAATVTMAFPDGLTPGLLPTGCVAGPPVTCTLGDLSTSATATLEFPVVGTAPGTLATLATATSITPDPDSTNNRVFAIVTVGASADVRVKLAISPSPGYVGGRVKVTVTIRNDGPTDSAVALAVRVPDDAGPPDDEDCVADTGCDLGQIAAGSKVVRTIVLAPEASLRGPVKADVTGSVADPDLSNNADRVRLTVLQPTLQLLPPLGPPGFVTLAVGEDFPPGARVALTWDPGLNASDATLKVARDGTFDTPVVVLMRDQLGPRTILAKRTKGLKFSPAEAEFLVVPRSQAPPDFVGRG